MQKRMKNLKKVLACPWPHREKLDFLCETHIISESEAQSLATIFCKRLIPTYKKAYPSDDRITELLEYYQAKPDIYNNLKDTPQYIEFMNHASQALDIAQSTANAALCYVAMQSTPGTPTPFRNAVQASTLALAVSLLYSNTKSLNTCLGLIAERCVEASDDPEAEEKAQIRLIYAIDKPITLQ